MLLRALIQFLCHILATVLLVAACSLDVTCTSLDKTAQMNPAPPYSRDVPQVKLIEAKLPWIEYSEAMKEFEATKLRRKAAEDCLAARKQEYEESQQPLRYVSRLRSVEVCISRDSKRHLHCSCCDDKVMTQSYAQLRQWAQSHSQGQPVLGTCRAKTDALEVARDATRPLLQKCRRLDEQQARLAPDADALVCTHSTHTTSLCASA